MKDWVKLFVQEVDRIEEFYKVKYNEYKSEFR